MILLMHSASTRSRTTHKVLLLTSFLLLQLLLVAALSPGRVTAADLRVVGVKTKPKRAPQGAVEKPLLEAAAFPNPNRVPQIAKVSNCRKGYVALTFDDGPSIFTPQLVKLLERLQIPATFFMVGSRIDGHRQIVHQVRDGGFGIGSHTWDHANLLSLAPQKAMWELRSTNRALAEANVGPTELMRPPYGLTNGRIRKQARSLGLTHVMWTADSNDWRGGGPHQIAGRVLAQLRPHTPNIVLQHDGLSRSPLSIRAVPIIVKQAAKRGYCFTSLNAQGKLVTPGNETAPVPSNPIPPAIVPEPGATLTPAP